MSSTQQKYSNLQMGITFNQEFLWRFFLFFVSNESIDLSVVSAVNDKVLKWQAMQIKGLYSLSCGDHQSLKLLLDCPCGVLEPGAGWVCVRTGLCVSMLGECVSIFICVFEDGNACLCRVLDSTSLRISPPHTPCQWLGPQPAGAPACWCTDGSRCSGVYWLTLGCCLLTFYALLALYAAQ